jgi:uncharacterized protein YkwD
MSRRLPRAALIGLTGLALAAVPMAAAASPDVPAATTATAPAPVGMPPAADPVTLPSATQGVAAGLAAEPAAEPAAAGALPNSVAGLLDTGRRRGVTTMYDSEWGASSPSIGFTGNIAGCVPGTTSAAFRAAVIRRVNAYRRLSGAPADVTESSTFSTRAQAAALMMAANDTLSHSPPSTWRCYTSTGHDAAGSSDLFLGRGDITTVDGYMYDPFSNNTEAGHRWWILRPSGTQMGVGSTNGSSWDDRANALYVNDGRWTDRSVRSPDGMLTWPAPGFMPYQLVPMRWTFLVPGGDYSAAKVTMTINGRAEPVTVDVRGGGFGQVVFHRSSQDVNAWTQMAAPSTDLTVKVWVSGVKVSGVTRTYSYESVVYDPADSQNVYRGDVAGLATVPVQVAGRGGVAAGATAAYLNVTVTHPGASGYLTVFPCTSSMPKASTLNFTAGRTIANAALTALDASGRVCVYTTATADLVIDVGGQAGAAVSDRYLPRSAPLRVLDTRLAGNGGRLGAATVRTVALTGPAGHNAVPASATGAVVNVTTVGSATNGGYITAYPCDAARPVASTLNTRTRGAISNVATVKLSAAGTICLYSSAPTQVVLDVEGAVMPSSAGGSLVTAMTPTRILDTRVSGSGGALGLLVTRRIQVTGQSGMPSAATAAVVNLTVVNPDRDGWLLAWPCGAVPTASNINYVRHEVIAGQATVGLDSSGGFCLRSFRPTQVVVDVTATYATTGKGIATLTPHRLLDTRVDG